MTGFIEAFFYSLSQSQSIIALSLIYQLHKSLGHAKSSQSSLVVSWQRIYKSHCNYNTHEIFFPQANSMAVLCVPSILILVLRCTSLYSFNSHSRTPLYFVSYPLIIPRHVPDGKHFFYECVFIGALPIDGCPSIVESVTSGMCLPSRCLAMITCVTITFNFPPIDLFMFRKYLRITETFIPKQH
jgi:hypothetical protein